MEIKVPVSQYKKNYLPIEAYLEMGNATGDKHEYYKSEIFAVSCAKVPHNIIFSNLLISLGLKLKRK